jgi:hypothetical protein
LGRVYNFRSGCMQTMHLLPDVAIQPNLELKTWPKPVLGSLPLAFALPGLSSLDVISCTTSLFCFHNYRILVRNCYLLILCKAWALGPMLYNILLSYITTIPIKVECLYLANLSRPV